MIKKDAFNLIELMIVVAIIAFLATLALPRYTHYFQKARQAEVALNLSSLHTAQETYFATHGEYTTKLWGKNSLGWKPQGYQGGGKQEHFYYTYGFNTPDAQEGIHYFTGKLETPKTMLGATFAKKNSFLIKAAALHEKNAPPDVWSINEKRSLKQA